MSPMSPIHPIQSIQTIDRPLPTRARTPINRQIIQRKRHHIRINNTDRTPLRRRRRLQRLKVEIRQRRRRRVGEFARECIRGSQLRGERRERGEWGHGEVECGGHEDVAEDCCEVVWEEGWGILYFGLIVDDGGDGECGTHS